ncbi:hypothetical protein [Burkholderia contaminans]|uniref:hypothetical protein n=1 Tax=Burkholderia contaminans TaxID=488447 RepID=UPI003C7BBE23
MLVIVIGKYAGGFVTFAIDASCTAVFTRRRMRDRRRVNALEAESTARAVAAGLHACLTQPAAMADLIAALRARALSSGETHAEPDTRSADRPPQR